MPHISGCKSSLLFIFRWCKKSKSPFIAADLFIFHVGCVTDSSLVLIWGTKRLKEPRKVWGLVEGLLRVLVLVLLIPCLAQ